MRFPEGLSPYAPPSVESTEVLPNQERAECDFGDFVVQSGSSNPKLANDVISELKSTHGYIENEQKEELQEGDISESIVGTFADGETRIRIAPNLRGKQVFIIQSTSPPNVDHAYMEQFIMIGDARTSSARERIAVSPYFGYARQDKKLLSREPITARYICDMYEAVGTDRIVSVDIHSLPIQGFFRGPFENLEANSVLVPEMKNRGWSGPNTALASPDEGGMKRIGKFSKLLKTHQRVMVYKDRPPTEADQSETLFFIGNVDGEIVIIIDDMISTGKTTANAADLFTKNGAAEVYAVATHGIFSENALDRISNSSLKEVIVTDTITPRDEVKNHPKITIVSVAPLLAEAIHRIHTNESLSKLFLRSNNHHS